MTLIGGAVPPGLAPPATASATPATALPVSAGVQAIAVQVIAAGSEPQALSAARRPLAGEVVAAGADGQLTIATAAGILRVQAAQLLAPTARVIVVTAPPATGTALPEPAPTLLLRPAAGVRVAGIDRTAAAPAAVSAAPAPAAAAMPVTIADARPLIAVTLGPTVWRAPVADDAQTPATPPGAAPSSGPATDHPLLPARSLVAVRLVAAGDAAPPPSAPSAPPPSSPSSPPSPGAAVRPPTPAALASGDVLAAVVRSVLANGERVIDAAGSSFLLPAAAGGQPGDRLGLVLAGRPLPALAQTPAPGATTGSTHGGALLPPAVRAAAQWLQDAGSGTETARATLLPRPGGELAQALGRLFAGLSSGELADWLGSRALDEIARARPELSAALARGFEEVAAETRTTQSHGWTQAAVPLLLDTTVVPLQLAWRGQDDEPGNGEEGGGERRLLVDIAFSRLGRTQLDALLSPRSRVLAVVVRTGQSLPEPTQREIAAIVDSVAGAARCRADLHFAHDGRFVEPALPQRAVQGGLLV